MKTHSFNLWKRSATRAVLAFGLLAPFTLQAADRIPGTGALREDPQQYERFRSVPAYRDYLPDKVDLSDMFPDAGDQGQQGSCTAWSVSYGLRSFYRNVETQSRPKRGLSPGFVYNQLKTDRNDCAEPVRISDALKFLEKRGTVLFEEFPYSENACADLPDPALQSLAQDNRIDGWRRLEQDRLDDIKGQLAKGNPVVIGMLIDDSLVDLQPGEIYDQQVADSPDLVHALVLVGYDESKRAFRAFNSWGTDWAERGFGWLSYKSVFSDLDSAFVADVEGYSEAKLAAARSALSAAADAATPQQPAPAPVQETPQVAAQPSLQSGVWKVDLSRVAGRMVCANLSMEIKGGELRALKGYVAQDEDLASLGRVLATHVETQETSLQVNVRPWPQCEALNTFARTFAKPQGLNLESITVDGTPTASFKTDDYLGIRVTSPDFPAYLYVTYMQSGGDAVHLVGWQKGGEQYAPGSVVDFGLDEKAPRFRISPPYGREMVIVVASSEPLFDEDYDIVEEERAYLTRFRQRMLDIGGGAIEGRFAAGAAYLTTSGAE